MAFRLAFKPTASLDGVDFFYDPSHFVPRLERWSIMGWTSCASRGRAAC